ncbi:hypothetical protein [Amycolatopsis acidicola]|nr:hypothetical protein [Amycolatopsis acidicola]
MDMEPLIEREPGESARIFGRLRHDVRFAARHRAGSSPWNPLAPA